MAAAFHSSTVGSSLPHEARVRAGLVPAHAADGKIVGIGRGRAPFPRRGAGLTGAIDEQRSRGLPRDVAFRRARSWSPTARDWRSRPRRRMPCTRDSSPPARPSGSPGDRTSPSAAVRRACRRDPSRASSTMFVSGSPNRRSRIGLGIGT